MSTYSSVIFSFFLSFCLLTESMLLFHDFPWPSLKLHHFPGPEITTINSMTFQVFPDPNKSCINISVNLRFICNRLEVLHRGICQEYENLYFLNCFWIFSAILQYLETYSFNATCVDYCAASKKFFITLEIHINQIKKMIFYLDIHWVD